MGLADRDYMRAPPPRRSSSVVGAVRLLAILAVLGIAIVALRSHHGSGLTAGASRWPGGVVRFYNAAAGQQWAVDRAVAAWNTSGASVRFVPVAESEADLVIKYSGPVCRAGAEATVGRVADATVLLPRLSENDGACNKYSAAVFAAHELGHVLGLTHQLVGCAAMNPAGNYRGPEFCAPAAPGSWWCSLLEPVDVARAVRLYGGTVRPRQQQYCTLYPAPAAPAGLTASAVPGGLQMSFQRPATPAIPAFVALNPANVDSFTTGFSRNACAATGSTHYRWTVPAGGTMTVSYQAVPGTYCFTVSAWDRSGQHGPTASYRVALN